jgi:hypothetical protein
MIFVSSMRNARERGWKVVRKVWALLTGGTVPFYGEAHSRRCTLEDTAYSSNLQVALEQLPGTHRRGLPQRRRRIRENSKNTNWHSSKRQRKSLRQSRGTMKSCWHHLEALNVPSTRQGKSGFTSTKSKHWKSCCGASALSAPTKQG